MHRVAASQKPIAKKQSNVNKYPGICGIPTMK